MAGTVRMETPVIYFYAPEDVTVSVDVDFREGVITDWFPPPSRKPTTATMPAGQWSGSRISWKNVRVSPGLSADFPTEAGSSHYYAARATDATPLQAGADRERFLFYRGVGQFVPPLTARTEDDGSVVVASTGPSPIGTVVAFENRGGRTAHRVLRDIGWNQIVAPLALDDESEGPGAALVDILTANGLYRREAEAMVETWRDSWFEEGSRLFYIAPAPFVDAMLPMAITPAPSDVARVFVGRVELVTLATKRAVAEALLTNNRAALRTYGRFLEPIARSVIADSADADRAILVSNLGAATWEVPRPAPACR